MIPVERADDPRLADYLALNNPAERARREREEFFITEGPVALARLLESDHPIRSVLLSTRRADRFAELLMDLDAPVYVTSAETLRAVVGFDLHRGVVAAAERRPLPPISDVVRGAHRIAVLEGLNDPENLGAIARSARAFGIDGMILDPSCLDPYYRRAIRVSMGEILFLPCARSVQWPDDLRCLHEAGFETWALTPDPRAEPLWEVPTPARVAVVFGSEGPGLVENTMRQCTRLVRVPIETESDSLNVAAAAAVTFAELSRRASG